jgi:hypothetical protein
VPDAPTHVERRHSEVWPASLALLACAGLYVFLTPRLLLGPKWIVPILIVLPLIPLSLRRHRHPSESRWVRRSTISLIAIVNVVNVTTMVLLVHHLLKGTVTNGRGLVYSAIAVWVTNVIVFGLWFWELDRNGPSVRGTVAEGPPDLQFPQMEHPERYGDDWRPQFIDYLYTAYTNGTSFAPADAMPLTARLKILFTFESSVSLVTVAVVAARAVNILH